MKCLVCNENLKPCTIKYKSICFNNCFSCINCKFMILENDIILYKNCWSNNNFIYYLYNFISDYESFFNYDYCDLMPTGSFLNINEKFSFLLKYIDSLEFL